MEIQELHSYPETEEINDRLILRGFGKQLDILKALSSETRLKIIKLLQERRDTSERGLDISTLACLLNQTEANISAQCKRLEKVGLIKIEYRPGGHGVRKICQVDFNAIEILLDEP
ncbi:MAG: ArsR/SmtB family transcription factor [Promethearchaeota archaeon]